MPLVFGDPSTVVGLEAVGNESVPKIIINNTINLFSETAISILVISNHNCFRVLFGAKLLPHIAFENCIYILALEMARPWNQHCVGCIGTLSFPIQVTTTQ